MKKLILLMGFLTLNLAQAQTPDRSQASSCVACHGQNGEGNLSAGYPRLAQLPRAYIKEQLADYASGVRNNSIMTPMAKTLSEEQKNSLAEYYSGLELPQRKFKSSHSQLVLRGEHLASQGDQKMQLQACSNCHGPGGTGQHTFIPMLAGQPAKYLESQLLAWQKGERKNSPNQMAPVTTQLDQKSIEALSAYFAQVSLPTHKLSSGKVK